MTNVTAAFESLTNREYEVLLLICNKGYCNKEIARELSITEGTVKGHVGFIRKKLGVTTRLKAVILAYRSGWVK